MNSTGLNTIREAAEKLSVCRATVFQMLRIGKIKATRVSARKVFIRQAEIEAFLSTNTK